MQHQSIPKKTESVAVLRNFAKEIGIKSVSKYKKDELYELILEKSGEQSHNDTKDEEKQHQNNDAAPDDQPNIEHADDEQSRKKTQPAQNNTKEVTGILEVLADGYGFLRGDNYLTTPNDVYVSPLQIRRFNLKTGDYIYGITRSGGENERFDALIYVKTVNGDRASNIVAISTSAEHSSSTHSFAARLPPLISGIAELMKYEETAQNNISPSILTNPSAE